MSWLKDLFTKKTDKLAPTGAILKALQLRDAECMFRAWKDQYNVNMLSNEESTKKLYGRWLANPRVREALDRAKSFNLMLIGADKFEADDGVLRLNGHASDDEIIKFLLGE